MKKIITLGIMLLFLGMTISSSTGLQLEKQYTVTTLSGNTFYVGGSGSNNYTKIQDAIDNASNGDTVFVFDDSSPYYERLFIEKSINIIGENRDTTIIDGIGIKYHIIYYSDGNVTFSNFTVRNASLDYAIIYLNGKNCKIINNRIYSNRKYGIITESGNIISHNLIYDNEIGIYGDIKNKIYHNTIYNNSKGILFQSGTLTLIKNSNEIRWNNISNNKIGIDFRDWRHNYNIISDNIISNNNFGIYTNLLNENYFGLFTSFNGNTISNNQIFNNKKTGIYLECGAIAVFNKIIGNQIYSNKESGITLYVPEIPTPFRYPKFNQICDNNITSNGEYGILIEKWSFTKVKNNIISNHNEWGIYLVDSIFCSIKNNDFLNNTGDASFEFNKRYHGREIFLKTRIFLIFSFNKWDNNYWNEPRTSPYKIEGIAGYSRDSWGNLVEWPGKYFDWHPAQEPYGIEV